ncbi:MOS1T transposase, partial [Pseudoatta argentina]
MTARSNNEASPSTIGHGLELKITSASRSFSYEARRRPSDEYQPEQDKELEQLLDEDPSQTLSEFGKILQVDESTVSKRLKGLGMIQKQGHWVPYELKPRDVERCFGTCELLLQRQKRKGFLGGSLSTSIDAFESSLKRKTAAIHDKVILLHDDARPHVAKPVKTYLETLKWEVLPHPLYSPDIAPSDFHLF